MNNELSLLKVDENGILQGEIEWTIEERDELAKESAIQDKADEMMSQLRESHSPPYPSRESIVKWLKNDLNL